MGLDLYFVEAFLRHQEDGEDGVPFSGNPAAVVLLESELPEEKMQSIAAELNQPMTAFIRPLDNSEGFEKATQFSMRWFNSSMEISICGHATLASTHTLLNIIKNPANAITFKTKTAQLIGERYANNRVTITLPMYTPLPLSSSLSQSTRPILLSLLGSSITAQLEDTAEFAIGNNGMLIVCLQTEGKDIKALEPDFQAMKEILLGLKQEGPVEPFGVLATCAGEGEIDYFCRVFEPVGGHDEDPVTGSANALLVNFWANKLGKKRLRARQLSQRTGDLELEIVGDRVRISGMAREFLRGKLNV
ncbi:uncharacterized protein VTP21DRAFT_4366 [Calcarisporiella thermophila]|uniref:uncharacterized protein n=1 Tax=Calcarisporiella thermophila TaxID=911321 RepID=UPI003742974C